MNLSRIKKKRPTRRINMRMIKDKNTRPDEQQIGLDDGSPLRQMMCLKGNA